MRLPWHRPGTVTCPQCGAEAPGDARWCGTCGAALFEQATPDPDADDGAGGGDGRTGRVLAAALVIAVLGGLLVAQAATDEPAVPAGYASRGDGARTGIVSATDVPPPSGVAWRVPVELPPLMSPGADVLGTTVADGRELVVVLDPAVAGHRITSHDAATGEVVATTMLPLGNQPYDTSLSEGLVAHRDLTSVTLVDAATGEQRWRVERRLRDDTAVTPYGVVGAVWDEEGLGLVLLDRDDGSEVWRGPHPGGTVRTILIAADTIVLAGQRSDGALFLLGLDPATGTERWSLAGGAVLPPPESTLPPPVSDGEHVLVVGGRRVAVVDAADGQVRPVELPDGFVAATGDLDGGRGILADGNRQLVGLQVTDEDASTTWRATLGQPPVLAVDVAGDVTAVRTDGNTSLLDTATGDTLARVAPGGGSSRLSATSSGAVARVTPDGHVELVGLDGTQWREPTVAVHLADLATDQGAVAVTTPEGVDVFEVDDGLRRFAHEAFQPGLVDAASLTPPVLLGGRAAIAPPERQPPERGGLLALFADTGIVDWARTDDQLVPRGVPVVDRDLIVVPVGSQLLGFDRVTGRRALVVQTSIARTDLAAADGWLVATDAPRDTGDLWVGRRSSRDLVFRAPIRTCAPPVLHEDVVIVVNHLGDIVARLLEDGSQPWGERAGGSACRPLSIAGDVLVALVDDRELLAVTLDDGDTAWRLDLPDVAAGAPVVAGDQVLVPTLAGEVLAYDVVGTTAPEEPAWRADVEGVPAGAVAVDGDTVLVATRSGELVALR